MNEYNEVSDIEERKWEKIIKKEMISSFFLDLIWIIIMAIIPGGALSMVILALDETENVAMPKVYLTFNILSIILFGACGLGLIAFVFSNFSKKRLSFKKSREHRYRGEIKQEKEKIEELYLKDKKKIRVREIVADNCKLYQKKELEYNEKFVKIASNIIIFAGFLFVLIGLFWNEIDFSKLELYHEVILIGVIFIIVLSFFVFVIIAIKNTLKIRSVNKSLILSNFNNGGLEDYIYEENIKKMEIQYFNVRVRERKILRMKRSAYAFYLVVFSLVILVTLYSWISFFYIS